MTTWWSSHQYGLTEKNNTQQGRSVDKVPSNSGTDNSQPSKVGLRYDQPVQSSSDIQKTRVTHCHPIDIPINMQPNGEHDSSQDLEVDEITFNAGHQWLAKITEVENRLLNKNYSSPWSIRGDAPIANTGLHNAK